MYSINYLIARSSFTAFMLAPSTKVDLTRLCFLLVDFLVRMWLWKACFLLILPVAVSLNRFLAAQLVFTFGILLYFYKVFNARVFFISFLQAISISSFSCLRGRASDLLCRNLRVGRQISEALSCPALGTISDDL